MCIYIYIERGVDCSGNVVRKKNMEILDFYLLDVEEEKINKLFPRSISSILVNDVVSRLEEEKRKMADRKDFPLDPIKLFPQRVARPISRRLFSPPNHERSKGR